MLPPYPLYLIIRRQRLPIRFYTITRALKFALANLLYSLSTMSNQQRLTFRLIRVPAHVWQPVHGILGKGQVEVLHALAGFAFQLRAVAARNAVCAKVHGQVGRVARAFPGPRGNVAKVSRVQVAECSGVCFVAAGCRLDGRAKEQVSRKTVCGGSVRCLCCAEWNKRAAFIVSRTDNGGLARKVSGQSTLRGVGEEGAVIHHLDETETGSFAAVRVLLEELFNVDRGHTPETLNLGFASGGVASKVLGDKGKVRVLHVVALQSEQRIARIHNVSRSNGVLGVGEIVVVDGNSTCRLAPERDTAWVTAKVANVVSNPFDSQALVQQAQILLAAFQGAGIGKAKNVHSVAGDKVSAWCFLGICPTYVIPTTICSPLLSTHLAGT